jgi:hypothetical protein
VTWSTLRLESGIAVDDDDLDEQRTTFSPRRSALFGRGRLPRTDDEEAIGQAPTPRSAPRNSSPEP